MNTSSLTRRRLLHHGAIGTGAAAAFSLLPRPLTAMLGGKTPEPIPSIQDDRIKALVQRGLDAAKAAGATYADIRMTHTRDWGFGGSVAEPFERAWLHVGVRALVDGYWGFATSPVWSPEELVRLGREATRQAKANTIGKLREVVLPPIGPARDGHWETPIEIDPFQYNPDEISDYILALREKLQLFLQNMEPANHPLTLYHQSNAGVAVNYSVLQQSKAFGATDGSYCTQRLYRSNGGVDVWNSDQTLRGKVEFTPTGAGWEIIRNSPLEELLRQDILHNQAMSRLPIKPIEVSKYATVLDAESVARLLSQTIGVATQLDRSLGYEANAGGTSYLTDPLAMMGNYSVASPLLTVTANRNEPGGVATVKWDEEGTEPTPFTLIDRGVVSDFSTSRESAGWLKPASDRLGRPFRSNGCMYSETAKQVPSIHTPNMVMQPAATLASQGDLEVKIDKGMSIVNFAPVMDFQAINGYGSGFECFEIANGKRVARISGAGILFRTSELWKAITTLGGAESQQRFGLWETKGQPIAASYHSVTAVPIALKELTFIDSARR